MSHWRDRARPIIQRVLAETANQSDKVIKAALRAAYPFGPREYHPYKIWLDEIRRQRKPRQAASMTPDICATCRRTILDGEWHIIDESDAATHEDCEGAGAGPVQLELG